MQNGWKCGKDIVTDVTEYVLVLQVADFVDRYMPAYKVYLPSMYAQGPTTGKAGHLLMLEIDENRGLTAQQPACPL